MAEGHEGWDDYAPFYDWENARTLGRRDVPFWRNLAVNAGGPVLELGCGTGRIALPLGRAGVHVVGIDRSDAMLARARTRVRRSKLSGRVDLVRADIRHLPFGHAGARSSESDRHDVVHVGRTRAGREDRTTSSRTRGSRVSSLNDSRPQFRQFPAFPLVIAPYGILQSLLRERDLAATLASVHDVLEAGGTFGLELVADLPSWDEYRKRVSLEGWKHKAGGAHVTLVETVRQDRQRHLTIFDQEFVERRGRTRQVRRFSLTFRTLSVPQMARRLEKAGFQVTALLGDYRGGPWDERADVWVMLAKKG